MADIGIDYRDIMGDFQQHVFDEIATEAQKGLFHTHRLFAERTAPTPKDTNCGTPRMIVSAGQSLLMQHREVMGEAKHKVDFYKLYHGSDLGCIVHRSGLAMLCTIWWICPPVRAFGSLPQSPRLRPATL